MRFRFLKAAFAALCLFSATPAAAQFNIGKAASGAVKVGQALTLSDADMANYVKEYIKWIREFGIRKLLKKLVILLLFCKFIVENQQLIKQIIAVR